MKMSSKYWIQRALQQEQNAQVISDRYMANVGSQLASYRQDLISEIETFYARYAKDHKMSHAEAKRYLRDNEMKEFQGVTLEKFRAMALNPDTPTPLLDALSYRHRISRKEALLAEIERKTAELYGGKDGIADNVVNNMSEVYVKGKIQQMKNLADFGIVEKPILNLKAVKNKLATNWSGQEFSERVWGQSQRTFNSIQKVIDQGLTGGWSVDRMSKELIVRTGVAYSQAETLVRTETTFYNNLATLDTIKDLGGEYYEIVAVLDTRTSDICRHENKKIYPISEYKAGQTAPPFHVRCRSTIMPSHQSKDGDKSDNPYVDILMNDHKVNVAPSEKSLNDVFDEWEREGDRLLGKVGYPSVNQAKQKGKKVIITEQAIDKVKIVEIPEYSYAENANIQLMHKQLLRDSMLHNNSNEVAYVLTNNKPIKIWGSEQYVDFSGSSDAVYLFNVSPERSLTVLHNHPGGSSFSTNDVYFFLRTNSVKTLSIVTNQGKVMYITKTSNYSYDRGLKAVSNIKSTGDINKDLEKVLEELYNVGIRYKLR